jgi:hypothetical protein
MRSYVIRNTPCWITHDQFLSEYLLLASRDSIQDHFRTSLTDGSVMVEKELSGQLVNGKGCVMSQNLSWTCSNSSGGGVALLLLP